MTTLTRIPTADEIAVSLAADSLKHMIREAWPLVEPKTPLVWGWYSDAICEHLEAVSRGEITRLLINQPPRTAKSLVVNVFWPAWEWIKRPELRYLNVSHSAGLAIRDAVRSRAVMTHPGVDMPREEVARAFAGSDSAMVRLGYKRFVDLAGEPWEFSGDQNVKGRYENDRKGLRIATGLTGMATGEGGDRVICLDGATTIHTDQGDIPIERIVRDRLPVRVLGSGGSWQEIEEYESSPGREMIEIETDCGQTLRCTEDHPIWLDGHGYRPAREVFSLRGPLYMRHLRQGVRPSASTRSADQAQAVLAGMSNRGAAGGAQLELGGRAGHPLVPTLRVGLHGEERDGAEAEILLQGLPGRSGQGAPDARVPDLRSVLQVAGGPDLLLDGLFVDSSRGAHEGRGQRAIHRRSGHPVSAAGVHAEAQGPGDRAGWWLRGLRREESAPRSPHRRDEGRSSGEEPRNPLFVLPPEGALQERDPRELDGATRIRHARRRPPAAAVYNLRVGPDHDYYANGLLAHNCDDPIDLNDAGSATKIAEATSYVREFLPTRLNSATSSIVMVMQRVSEDDPTGAVIDDQEEDWTHLCLPMEYEPKHPFVWPRDPRTEPGELLAPDRYDEKWVAKRKATIGSRAYAANYQQRPSPAEGELFKRTDWQRYVPEDLPHVWQRLIVDWDLTTGKKPTINDDAKGRSWVVGQVWGKDGARMFLLAQIRARFAFTKQCAAVADLSAYAASEQRTRWEGIPATIIEEAAAAVPLVEVVEQKVPGVRTVPVSGRGDKYARAEAQQPLVEAHNVYLPAGPVIPAPPGYEPTHVEVFIDEAASFPAGSNDDQVDCFSQAARELYGPGGNQTVRTATLRRSTAEPVHNAGGLEKVGKRYVDRDDRKQRRR